MKAVKPHLISYSLDRQNIRERAVSAGDGDVSGKRLFNDAFFNGGGAFGHRGDLIDFAFVANSPIVVDFTWTSTKRISSINQAKAYEHCRFGQF